MSSAATPPMAMPMGVASPMAALSRPMARPIFSSDTLRCVRVIVGPLNHAQAMAITATSTTKATKPVGGRSPHAAVVASTLNEFANTAHVDIRVDEEAVPVHDQVRGACEMLGYDVFQVANEGKMVCVCAPEVADAALAAMRTDKYGAEAAIIGEVLEGEGRVYLRTAFGSERILDMLVGEQLPRIC